jgi:uncharacterized protein
MKLRDRSRGIGVVLAVWLGLALLAAGAGGAEELSRYGNPFLWVTMGPVKVKAEVVKTQEKLYMGLSYRDALPTGQGMLFFMPRVEVQNFCMRDMQFSLDFIWIVQGKIVGVEKQVPPTFTGTISSPGPVNYVLEVPGGFVDSYGVKVGNEVSW